ncbi:hypothetical protein KI440_01445 [Candidatus Saccharibacteria bacterium TM7i]|nr:hypothetical protein KI440_01445 [Candidatus Saccharibacteria bacterium TM7i]
MSETPLHDTNTPENKTDDFAEIFEMQAADRARQLLLEQENTAEPANSKLRLTRRGKAVLGIAAGAAVTAGLLTAGISTASASAEPSFTPSVEQTTYTAPSGGSLWDAAEQIEGSEKVDTRDLIESIKKDPTNIPILEDGLQAGESINIPVHVEPK